MPISCQFPLYSLKLLNREATSDVLNEKWPTDATELYYYLGTEKYKVYLSAISDLYDIRILAHAVGDCTNNYLVFSNFNDAASENPGAHSLFHSNREFQYTNQKFDAKIKAAGMAQGMSRVARCIENDSIEEFWGFQKENTMIENDSLIKQYPQR